MAEQSSAGGGGALVTLGVSEQIYFLEDFFHKEPWRWRLWLSCPLHAVLTSNEDGAGVLKVLLLHSWAIAQCLTGCPH